MLLGGVFLSFGPRRHAQEAAAATGGTAAPPAKSVLRTIIDSGPLGVAIWVAILAASMTMVTFVIQNILTLRNDRLAPPPLLASLRQVLADGNYQEAWEICNANRNYLANVLKAGLERIGRGKDVFDDALAEHGLREAQILRTRNSYLSVIGVVSPDDRPARHGHRHDEGVYRAGRQRHQRPPRAGQQHRRGAPGHGQRPIHRHPGVRELLHFPQPRADGHRQRRGPAQLARWRTCPFEELQGVRIGENFSAGEGAASTADDQRARFDVADDQLPGVQRAITPGRPPARTAARPWPGSSKRAFPLPP